MKKLLLLLLALIIVLACVVFFRAWRFQPRHTTVGSVDLPAADPGAAGRLAEAVRFKTISDQDPSRIDSAAFLGLHAFIDQSFPLVHAMLRREVVSGLSLFYAWPGRDTTLRPVLLLSHMDVVPVEPGTEGAWTYAAFDSTLADGYVWGRGTMDDKVGVVGILEAVEGLLREGFVPERTVMLAFGHDEEIGGNNGAVQMAARLAARGIRPMFVLDEGGAVMTESVPGVKAPVALVGIAEKGYMSVELSVAGPGGHSSMPPPETTVGILSAAVSRLEANPLPAHLDGAAREMFDYLGPEMPFMQRAVFANLWLFDPIVTRLLAREPAANAMVRTTTAPTMLSGSPKENVLASKATAVVNFRILPGESSAGVLKHVREAVDDDRVNVTTLGILSEPSGVSDTGSRSYAMLSKTIREVVPADGLIVAPYLVVGATDARHYASLTSDVYRFIPFTLRPGDRERFHGTNERLAIADYETVVRFYARILRNVAGSP